ncbi:MAG: hypothetical protein WBA44_13425 [Mesorhizobium sp.]
MNKFIISAALVFGVAGAAVAQEAPDYLTNQNISTNAQVVSPVDQLRVNSIASKGHTGSVSIDALGGYTNAQQLDRSGR